MGVTIHHGTGFVVADDTGDLSPGGAEGFYHLSTRFLSRHALRLDGERPVVLQAFAAEEHEARHVLANPRLDGAPRKTLAIVLSRALGGGLEERLVIENHGERDARLEVAIAFGSDFAYVLTVKEEAAGGASGWHPDVAARVEGPCEVVLELRAPGTPHRAALRFDPAPARLAPDRAAWDVRLAPRDAWRATLTVAPSIGDETTEARPPAPERVSAVRVRRRDALGAAPRLETDHPVLARAYHRACRDLAALRIRPIDDPAASDAELAAGIPWYLDLFGRDCLVASYEAILHDPGMARGTLEALVRLQGRRLDAHTEEAPGKIVHEHRRGPLTPAARRLVPGYPYYATVDATPLFLVTLSEYVRVTGDLAFARDRWDAVAAAVAWMRGPGDPDGDGLLEYERHSDVGLVNHGWKDSDDAIRFRDGRRARPPVALVEVQGYALDARLRTAELARALGRPDDATPLEREAAALRAAIPERFWDGDRGIFAMALDGAKRRADALASNPGHLLWSRAVGARDAARISRALVSDALFSGFGIRTLGASEAGYNPMSYHCGSVWPHDCALALHGLARYGLRDEARRVASAMLDALAALPGAAMPELFCGFPAERLRVPIRYPLASRPQAWASAAVLLLVRTLCGLEIDALARHVSLAPLAVPGLHRLRLERIPVGAGHLDVEIRVDGDRATAETGPLPDGWTRVAPWAPE